MTLEELKKRRALAEQGRMGLRMRLEQLSNEMEQRKADLQATNGAIQEIDYWIAQLTPALSVEELTKAIETGAQLSNGEDRITP